MQTLAARGQPFMIINASTFIIDERGKMYARKSSRGIQNVEDPEITDFQLLYSLVTGHLCFTFRDHAETMFWTYFRKKQKKNSISQGRESLTVGIVYGFGIGITLGALGILLSKFKTVSETTK